MAENVKYLDPSIQKQFLKALFDNPDLIPQAEREKLFRDLVDNIDILDRYFPEQNSYFYLTF